jgi:threonine dehydrogenase-like Zn-dependent dehydrogenase
VTQLARVFGAKHAISSPTDHAKAEQAKALGFNEVIDPSVESWATVCVASRAVTAQTLSSTESVVKS